MNIIIPIGGIGKRFKDDGYDMPKPLINVLGKPMIYHVINSLKIHIIYDKIHIIYHNHLKEYNFESIIKFYFPNINISFTCLNYITKGAAETVYRGLESFTVDELQKSTLGLDCDTFYDEDIIKKYKEHIHKNIIFYFNDTDKNPLFSYITLDENNKVLNIKEKIKISNNANTGAYGFESGVLLRQYCEMILKFDDELYISRVYYEMLKNRIDIYGNEIKQFNCVGTPLQLKIYCNKNKDKTDKLRICFDLDNTLVSYPQILGDYSSVLPIRKNIELLKYLKSLGHTIIIYSARRMKTHSGNNGKILADIGQITFETLEKFNIPYDEIYFGKPYADFYIDDLAVNAYSNVEKSIGIYNDNIDTRHFNSIEYTKNSVIKYTNNGGEIYWYQNIPEPIKKYFPKVINIKTNILELEHINGVSYSYDYTHKSLSNFHISHLIEVLNEIHWTISLFDSDVWTKINIYSNYYNKLYFRFHNNYDLYITYGFDKFYDELYSKLIQYVENNKGSFGVIHGDPVFTNILRTNNNIKFIDMRGKQNDIYTIFGDVNYDFAKVYQSLIGYDFILNDIEIDSFYIDEKIKYFESFFEQKQIEDIKLITASLLFSLIPLHTENSDRFYKYYKLIEKLI